MAQPDNTYDAYDAGTNALTGGANREDLADIIYNIAPTETPFMMLAQRGTARNAKHEWLTDTLETAASNYQIEGDDYTGDARVAPNRLHAYTQISAKALTVSGTQEVVDKAGRKSEIAYQLALQAKELKRDIERHCVGFATTGDATALGAGVNNGGSYPNTLGTSTGARTTANLGTWINTNINDGGSTAPPTSAGQPTDGESRDPGTPRAFVESQLKEVIREAWSEGGNPSTIIVDPFNKQAISQFTGGSTRFDKSEDKRLVTAVDVYVSDFGDHTVIPDRFLVQPIAAEGVAAYVLDMNYWGLHYLRPFQQNPLAKTGDAEKRLLLAEWCICAKNEKSSGAVYDLTFA